MKAEALKIAIAGQLKAISCDKYPFYSKSATTLLLATALHESGGLKYNRQIVGRSKLGNAIFGPAMSYFQIEPDTARDCYENWLDYRPELRGTIDYFRAGREIDVALMCSLPFAISIARIKYWRAPGSIPSTIEGMAEYWLKNYNAGGKGTVKKFLDDWQRYSGEDK